MTIYIWHLSQKENNDWNTYDSMVVTAHTEEEAKSIHPKEKDEYYFGKIQFDFNKRIWLIIKEISEFNSDTWKTTIKYIQVPYEKSGWASTSDKVIARNIGVANNAIGSRQIICASFIAG